MVSITDIIESGKLITAWAKKLKNQEIVNLSLEMQTKVYELKDENESLKERIKELEKNKVNDEEIIFHETGAVYLKDKLKDDGTKVFYCGTCYGKSKLLIPLMEEKWYRNCGNCKMIYHSKKQK
jgi:hypothetical protein